MDKAIKILEKNVEWIAVGLAGLWMAWVGWTYFISKPPTVEIGNQSYTASTADDFIRRTEEEKLKQKLDSVSMPKFPVVNIASDFKSRLDPLPPELVPQYAWASYPPIRQLDPNNLPGKKADPAQLAKRLPKVPVPTLVALKIGRSQVQLPFQAPAAAVAGNQPAALLQVAAPADAQAGKLEDKIWESQFAKFSQKALEADFKEANIPPALGTIIYTHVQLERQEVFADGSYGTPEAVPALSISVPPSDRKLAPMQFIAWASADAQTQSQILQAPFYTVVKGTQWEPPVDPDKAAADKKALDLAWTAADVYARYKAIQDAKERAKFYKENVEGRSAKEKGDFYKLQQDDQENDRKNRAGNPQQGRPPVRPVQPPGRPGGRGAYDAQDSRVLREMYAQAEPAPYYPPRRTFYGPDGRPMPYPPGYGRYPYGGRPPMLGQPDAGPGFQAGGNVIVDANGNFDIWAHDDKAAPGKTYRYRLRVMIKNPLYNQPLQAADPKWATEPYLPIDPNEGWSVWSKPVVVPSTLDMQLAGGGNLATNKEQVRFNVWRWQKGQINKSSQGFQVGPGDIIGGPEKTSGIDYTTGWTIVDVRPVLGTNDTKVRLIDATGRMEVRSFRQDQVDPKFKELDKAITSQTTGQAVGFLPNR